MSDQPNRLLSTSATTKLTPDEYQRLCYKAEDHGSTTSEYLRQLIIADLYVNSQAALQTVEAEHTRLVILAAQQGQKLTPELLKELRNKAILSGPVMAANALRLIRQMGLPPTTTNT